ncbi:inactive phospholipase C-like protein 1 [Tachysurus ichikawai]
MERDCDGEETVDSIPTGAWRGARRSGVLLPDTDTPLLESVKAATAPRRSSIIKLAVPVRDMGWKQLWLTDRWQRR